MRPDGGIPRKRCRRTVGKVLITRRMELGIRLEDGGIRFTPTLLLEDEWIDDADAWAIPAGDHAAARTIDLPSDALGFQLCGIPVTYRRVAGPGRITLVDRTGGTKTIAGDRIDATEARSIFDRKASIERIEVEVTAS